MTECFFLTLKLELVDHHVFHSHQQPRIAVFEFIESWFNHQRGYFNLGYLSPEEFYMKHIQKCAYLFVQ
ncbi:integrase-like protein [Sediminitomix flava]|uniref:Integrase-like protein n=2 Tax=Sediminitomix flava TaxID=379075 RepID=A0A315Z614_SEDFL|nr:integrase-like protein [Sediminitomix flava]